MQNPISLYESKSTLVPGRISSASLSKNVTEKLNIIIVGPYSSGKTTILQTICNSFKNLELKKSPEEIIQKEKKLASTTITNKYFDSVRKLKHNTSVTYYSSGGMGSKDFVSQNTKDLLEELSLNEPEEQEDLLNLFNSNKTTLKISKHTLFANLSESCFFNCPDNETIELTLVDTPGFNVIEMHDVKQKTRLISKFIQGLMEEEINEELNSFRKINKTSNLIHAVIYVFQPPSSIRLSSAITRNTSSTFLSPLDLISPAEEYILTNLSKISNVIPVVGKSDTLSNFERSIIQQGLFSKQLKKTFPKIKFFDFLDKEELRQNNYMNMLNDEYVTSDIENLSRKIPFLLAGSDSVGEYQSLEEIEKACEVQNTSQSNTNPKRKTPENKYVKRAKSQVDLKSKGKLVPTFLNVGFPESNYNKSNYCNIPTSAHFNQTPSKQTFQNPQHAAISSFPSPVMFQNTSTSKSNYQINTPSTFYCINRSGQLFPTHFGRGFPWGELNLLDPKVCDFGILLQTIFHTHRQSLVEHVKNVCFEEYRASFLLKKTQKKKIFDRNENLV
ncbi:hypothetical protein BB559_005977 [Furculomyces boomerangus]|uniref:Septin-type G domain-containing protein n=1 Tax=Furculomyces boomerangus TaxID=61424 RepID=A0A2T9XZM8_9FUNG|nr:hypothetical protein BB559_006948 [Furculomyces boomerangus]PVU87586.1 hypothetical protein BB559_005977 [Furculomyces boomerangus]